MSNANTGGKVSSGRLYDGELTVRDAFAISALPQAMTEASGDASVARLSLDATLKVVAAVCYKMADAMLAERAK